MGCTRIASGVGVAILALAGSAAVARADRYEATLTVHPTAAMGRVSELVAGDAADRPVSASVRGGGFAVGLAYGIRNWLDVSAELEAVGFSAAAYSTAMITIEGNPYMGSVARATRMARLTTGATLRLGVAWVPVVSLGVSLGARQRTSASLKLFEPATDGIVPDGMHEAVTPDVGAVIGAGFERRLDRHWTIGAHASASYTVGIGAPGLRVVSGGLSVGYSWYPVHSP
jgi:hypothetical protein